MTTEDAVQLIDLTSAVAGPLFEGIGAVNGGGATSVLLKDYPEPQRSQILDLVFSPKFGASVSTMLVEVPGDGNATQGSMPSHAHTRDDLNHQRGYIAWVMKEAKRRNPDLTLDATAWSAPGWVGNGTFWHQDAADYYVSWLQGLREVHGLEMDAIGCRNEKGADLDFARALRATLNASGFESVRLHAFDHWPAEDKFAFLDDLVDDEVSRDAIDIVGAHVLSDRRPGHPSGQTPQAVQDLLAQWGKPLWNTEDHVYLDGFDCLIGIVECLNESYVLSGATKTVLWYDIAGVYPVQPYAVQPAMLLAHEPWSGHYEVREALWGYAHYGQFTELGWYYVPQACGVLDGGGTVVALASPSVEGEPSDVSLVIETKGAEAVQHLRVALAPELAAQVLCVWRSTAREQFVRQADLVPVRGAVDLVLEPEAVYSVSTTRGQRKGSFAEVPASGGFPLPYREDFNEVDPELMGYLPRYTADIAGAFEIVPAPDGQGNALRQSVPVPTISWAPDWKPYTILGDQTWSDYEVSVNVWLADGESAAVLARVNHVGTGYGFVPQCYTFSLASDGTARLNVVRGKVNKSELVGDNEQQAAILAARDAAPGGEKELASATLDGVGPHFWHRLTLRCEGSRLTGSVNGAEVLSVVDELYPSGQVGLLAGGPEIEDAAGLAGRSEAAAGVLSQPYFSRLNVEPLDEGPGGGVVPGPRARLY